MRPVTNTTNTHTHSPPEAIIAAIESQVAHVRESMRVRSLTDGINLCARARAGRFGSLAIRGLAVDDQVIMFHYSHNLRPQHNASA